MEIGAYTFADIGPGVTAAQRCATWSRRSSWPTRSGSTCSASASTTGPTTPSPSPAVVLAAGAARTERIRLTSAVTVLSSDDPVRVFQDFATLDLLSGGRAEIMAGRGSFIESFPLFGYDLDDYDELFAEKLELLLALIAQRARDVVGAPPRADRGARRLPAAGAGAAAGVDRGRRHAEVGRPRRRCSGCRWRSRSSAASRSASRRSSTSTASAAREGGHDPAALPVSINSHTYVAETSQQAADEFFPAYAAMMTRIGRERGWPPMTRAQFDAAALAARRARWSAARRRWPRRSSPSTSCSATTASSRR